LRARTLRFALLQRDPPLKVLRLVPGSFLCDCVSNLERFPRSGGWWWSDCHRLCNRVFPSRAAGKR